MYSDSNEMQVHLHIHEGASPEAVRAAVEAVRGNSSSPVESAGEEAVAELDPERFATYVARGYKDSSGQAGPMLEFLADNPGRLIPFTEVSNQLGFDTARSLPGLLGSFARRANHRYEGVTPYKAVKDNNEWHLIMSQEAADIINDLR